MKITEALAREPPNYLFGILSRWRDKQFHVSKNYLEFTE